MNQIILPPPAATGADTPVEGAFKIDAFRGQRSGLVSSQWFDRPADQRFLSLTDLFASVQARKEASREMIARTGQLMFKGSLEYTTENKPLAILDRATDMPIGAPTHYSFGQLSSLARLGKATSILRLQPPFLAAANLNWGLGVNRDEDTKVFIDDSTGTVRAATGPNYGRIFDAEVVSMVMRFAGTGTGDTRWKVPGMIDWAQMKHNPYVNITTDTTTLYASDRDVFIFLCDDTHPVEIGTLADGSPDLAFLGFIVSNSEVGDGSLRIMMFWLRGVCQNRNLWGMEDVKELRIVHSRGGPERFAREAEPLLKRITERSADIITNGVKAAKSVKAMEDADEGRKVLTADYLGFSPEMADKIMQIAELEEGRPPRSAWDLVNGITAVARTIPYQADRLDMERKAGKLMERAVHAAA
jgi:hypothetical protein